MTSIKVREYVLEVFSDSKGTLVPIELEKVVPFEVKRIYFCYDNKASRAGHCHLKEEEFFVCVKGWTKLEYHDGISNKSMVLSDSKVGIYIGTLIWHEFVEFSEDCVLLAMSSTNYNPNRKDYIEDYNDFINSLER